MKGDLLELVSLAVVAINGWNRLNVAFGAEAGHYEVGKLTHLEAS